MQNPGLFCIFGTLLIAKCCVYFRLLEGLTGYADQRASARKYTGVLLAQGAGSWQRHAFSYSRKIRTSFLVCICELDFVCLAAIAFVSCC